MIILIPFYAGVVAILLTLLSLYRLAAKPDFPSFALSLPGFALWCSIMILIGSSYWIRRLTAQGPPSQHRIHRAALLVNLSLTVMVTVGAELVIRARSVDTLEGTRIGRVLLHPLDWSQVVAHHQPILDRISHERPFFQYDPLLGWVVTPNHHSSNGLYRSSIEGLRSPEIGLSFADLRIRLTGQTDRPALHRIALLGDSMTFGHEVRCEESWPHVLERNLTPDVQILNFAVSGYSLSQTFLKYRRDVRLWHPRVVVIGVTSSDILRIMSIYNFLYSPTGVEFPYARPRLITAASNWQPVNLPLPTPKEIFAHASVRDLPHLNHDRYFHEFDWPRRDGWQLLEWSYLFRFLSSIRPVVTPLPSSHTDNALADLASTVLAAFVEEVHRDGAVPLIVHLPYQDELLAEAEGRSIAPPRGATLLRRTGIPFVETTPCLIAARSFDSFAPGGHYTAPANAAIAGCLADTLRPMLRVDGEKTRG